MFTIWLCACGPYGGESSTICKWSGAIALSPENPRCNQGDRWHGHCCGLMEKIKITFNKLWLKWAWAPQKSQFVSQTATASGIGGEYSGQFSVFNRFRLTEPELWSFSNCPFCLAEASQQIARFIALLKEIENMMSSIQQTNSWQVFWTPKCRKTDLSALGYVQSTRSDWKLRSIIKIVIYAERGKTSNIYSAGNEHAASRSEWSVFVIHHLIHPIANQENLYALFCWIPFQTLFIQGFRRIFRRVCECCTSTDLTKG